MSILLRFSFLLAVCQLECLSVRADIECPKGCTCTGNFDTGDGTVECTQIKMYSLLCDALSKAATVRITGSTVTDNTIKESMFAEFPLSTSLVLSNNQIQKIEPKAFKNLKHLQLLDLSNNNIIDLKPQSFADIQQCVTLNLAGNKVRNLVPKLFSELVKLTDLEMQNNELEEILPGTFNGLVLLNKLDLSNNNLQHLKEEVFQGLDQLEILDLSNNQLKFISQKLFQPLKMLKSLYLDHNVLENLPILEFQSDLQYFDVSYNKFPIIPMTISRSMSQLKILDISGNPIVAMKSEDFSNLNELQILHMNEMTKLNQIQSKTFDSLQNLQVITLQNHKEELNLDQKLFQNLPKLKHLLKGKSFTANQRNKGNDAKESVILPPGGIRVGPNVALLKPPTEDHKSFSEQLDELMNYYNNQVKKLGSSEEEIEDLKQKLPEAIMASNLKHPKQENSAYQSFASSFGQLKDDHPAGAMSINEQSGVSKGVIGGVIVVLFVCVIIVAGLLYRGRRARSSFVGYTPLPRENTDLLASRNGANKSYGTG